MPNFAKVKLFKRWTPEEDRDVMRMSYSDFQLIHDRTKRAIESRREYINNGYRTKSLKLGDIVKPAERPPAAVMAERDYRMALAPRDTTAALLGDPLPGRSALDRRIMEERRFDNPCLTSPALGERPIRWGAKDQTQVQERPLQGVGG
jgi:hypothetical protein